MLTALFGAVDEHEQFGASHLAVIVHDLDDGAGGGEAVAALGGAVGSDQGEKFVDQAGSTSALSFSAARRAWCCMLVALLASWSWVEGGLLPKI
jgi:hypothetical protein